MEGEKHCLMKARLEGDLCHAYHRHTSPGAQVLSWAGSVSSNESQLGLLELPANRDPHW